jgi:UDP-glucose 4-epimerase
MLDHIELWRDAPVWDEGKIKVATAKWFEFLEN